MKKTKVIICVLVIICAILSAFSVFVICRENYMHKVLVAFGLREGVASVNYGTEGWKNCMIKLDYDADIVFFGDSITRQSDFRQFFNDMKICNLGLSGDTLAGMKERVHMISAVNPELVFLLGGINGLRNTNINQSIQTYSELLKMIIEANQGSTIVVLSVLPISHEREKSQFCSNTTICKFNDGIKKLAEENDVLYIDLYSAYELNGEMNPAFSVDGVHIPNHYEPWAEMIKPIIYNCM